MASGNTRYRVQSWIIALLIFLTAAVAGCALSERDTRKPRVKSPPFVVQDHSQALPHWARLGIRNATLINFDAHDDMRRIPEQKMEALRLIYCSGDAAALEEAGGPGNTGLYNIGNFIYAAVGLGIVQEVYWVIPFTYFQDDHPGRLLRQFMLDYGFPRDVVNTFELSEGVYTGIYMGIPVTLCSLENLPGAKKRFLVSLDADFLPAHAEWHGCDRLTSMERLFSALRDSRIQMNDFLISYSVNGGYLSVLDRWLIPACSDFACGGAARRTPYPEIRMAYNLARIYYDEGEIDSLLRLTSRYLQAYPEDPTLKSFRSLALFGAGKKEQAISLAGDCCTENPEFCYLLADLGRLFLDSGAEEKAFECYRRAYAGNPHMNYRYREFADGLKAAGHYREATKYYRRVLKLNGGFAAHFQLAMIYKQENSPQKAVTECLAGLRAFEDQYYVRLDSEVDIRAVLGAISLLKSTGHAREASKLENEPVINAAISGHGRKQ